MYFCHYIRLIARKFRIKTINRLQVGILYSPCVYVANNGYSPNNPMVAPMPETKIIQAASKSSQSFLRLPI